MESFCTTNTRNKCRNTLPSSTIYQPPLYSHTHTLVRQNEYAFPIATPPSRQSYQTYCRKPDSLWDEQKCPENRQRRNQICSIALTTAIFLVAVVVLTIAGLAFYMGALTTDTTNPLIAFTCSMKITRGDYYTSTLKFNYTSAFREKSRRYKYLLETVYQKSLLGPAFVSCVIEKFKNVSLTIYFQLSFNRKRIPRSIPNAENTIKEILLNEIQSRKSLFRNIKIDPNSIMVKRFLENDYSNIYQRDEIYKPKNLTHLKNMIRKSNFNTNLTVTANIPIKRKPVIEEPEINEDDLPVVQGSFKITKTDADITEKKINISSKSKSIQPSTTTTTTTTTKKYMEMTTKAQRTSTTKRTFKPSIITTTTTTTTIGTNPTKESTTKIPTFSEPSSYIGEPWRPIRGPSSNPEIYSDIHRVGIAEVITTKTVSTDLRIPQEPVYKSFTNPSLTNTKFIPSLLGTSDVVRHPIPVDKFTEITTEFYIDEHFDNHDENLKIEDRHSSFELENDKGYVEIETLKYSPSSTYFPTIYEEQQVTTSNNGSMNSFSRWQLINGTDTAYNTSGVISNKIYNDTLQAMMTTNAQENPLKPKHPIIQNISSIFHTLASTIEKDPPSTTIRNKGIITSIEEDFEEQLDEPIIGHGLVEVINSTMEELLMKRSESSTKLPLVTLIPVKSNSGLRHTLRPRPKMNGDEEKDEISTVANIESRSFSLDFQQDEIVPTHLEFVTSISSEIKHVKVNRNTFLNNKTIEKNDPVVVVNVFSTISNTTNKRNDSDLLSASRLKKLAEISNIYGNNVSGYNNEPIISTKAVSSSYSINQAGIKILTKTFNKIPSNYKNENNKIALTSNSIPLMIFSTNDTECNSLKVKCGDGTCLPETTRCNQLMDCPDGSDEKNCTCADYLRSQFLLRKICDGVVDCWDFSDENNCDWCSPGQYVCLHSRTCIDKKKICDGVKDCPQGDDEKQCVIVAADQKAAEEFPYNSKGYLMIRKFGQWGKLCTENFEEVVANSHASWQISDLGRAVCRAMTYQDLEHIERIKDAPEKNTSFYELSFSTGNKSKTNLSFQKCDCNSKEVVKVKCRSLECGTRPQTTNHWARHTSKRHSRIVGGTNANLGSWPWQAALYKEGEFQCGATLISDLWLISAGHCFYHSQTDYWVARLGALRRGTSFPSPYEQLRTISNIILHPDYVDAGFINDISILRMQTPIIFSDYVRPICLPPANTDLRNGRICTVVGWGQLFEVGRIFPDTLQEVQLPVISTAECRKKTLFLPLYQVTDDMFCAGYDRGGRDACLGDSGGPLMCQENGNHWSLYGVTSNGYGCARANRPGVYTKVANYIEWIQKHMNSNETTTTTTSKSNAQICKGHRCPLGECLPKSRICNGYIECNDGSDEKDCF